MPTEITKSAIDPSWNTTIITAMDGGLNTTTLPDTLRGEESTVVENLSLRNGRVRVDTGSTILGSNNNTNGKFRTTSIWESGGSKVIIGITDETAVKLVTIPDGSQDWQYIPSPTVAGYKASTLVLTAAASAATIKVVTGQAFADGEKIGIMLTNGKEHHATISGAPSVDASGDTITITPVLPSEAPSSAAVKKRLALAGSIDKAVSTTSVPWGTAALGVPWVVFTNGVDKPMYFDGANIALVPNLTSGGNITCEIVTSYKGTLILANCVVGGSVKRNTIFWSDIGDPSVWDTGNSGYQAILEEGEEISAMRTLGPDMIVYGPRSITRMAYVGSTNFLFAFAGAVSGSSIGTVNIGEGIGCVSPNALFSTGDNHIFLAPNGIYSYSGGYSADLISQNVTKGYFDFGGLIDSKNIHRTFIAYMEEHRELYFFIPINNLSYTDTALVLDINSVTGSASGLSALTGGVSPRFRTRKFPGPISGAGVCITQTSVTWASAEGAWDDQPYTWGDEFLGSDVPTVTIGSSEAVLGRTGIKGAPTGAPSENVFEPVNISLIVSAGVGAIVEIPLAAGGYKESTIKAITGSPDQYFSINDPISDVTIYDLNADTIVYPSTGFSIYECNYREANDLVNPGVSAGHAIDWQIQTKDFSGFSKELRTDFIDAAIQGTSVNVSISRDSGNSYSSLGDITQLHLRSRSRLHNQGVGDKFRFKISGSAGNAEIGVIAFRYREEDKYRLV